MSKYCLSIKESEALEMTNENGYRTGMCVAAAIMVTRYNNRGTARSLLIEGTWYDLEAMGLALEDAAVLRGVLRLAHSE